MNELKLASNERLIKEYKYQTLKKGAKVDHEDSIIVTNKRIVKQSVGKSYVERNEVPVSAAAFVSCSMEKQIPSIQKAIVFTVLAALMLIIGIVFATRDGILGIVGIPFLALFVVFAIIALVAFLKYRATDGCTVIINVMSTKAKNELLCASFNKSYDKKMKKVTLKTVVDRAVAEQMVNELSAMIIDAQEGSLPAAPTTEQ